jgi:broad specificity phosphatase PhoE
LQVEFDLHEWLPDLTFRFDSFEPVQQAINERKAHGNEWPPGVACNWESFSKICQRVNRVLSRYAECESVLVVCHQTVIEALTGVELQCAETLAFPYPAAT